MAESDPAVIVAVGDHGADAALTYAVEEARRSGSPLHLVHVLRVPGAGPYEDLYAAAVDQANATLEAAVTAVRDLADADVTVTGEVVTDGGVVGELVRCADRGRMVVLQHRRLGLLHRILTGSTVNGVAARAEVPVVSVPEDWVPRIDDLPVVTVGVQDAEEAEGLLRLAYGQALRHPARLVILHSWWLAGDYGLYTVVEALRAEQEQQFRVALSPTIGALTEERPGVDVEVVVRFVPAAEALLSAAKTSDLLVLGRRHHLLPLGSHLGPVARAVLAHSAGPVMMAPQITRSSASSTHSL